MELWDAYKADGTLAGFDLVRGEKIPAGYFHMVCEAVIQHADGDYLLMQRSFTKEVYPGAWEIGAGGSALKDESKLETVLREVRQETGIDTGEFKEIYQLVQEKQQAIYYGYLLKTDCPKDTIKLQEGETIDYKWLTKDEFIEFFDTKQEIPTLAERLRDFVDSVR
jgi:8-oxo-dGTP pyrophosphatase MutT (NUDIX family)